MNTEARRRAFDLTIWIGTLVTTFGLLAFDACADDRRRAAPDPVWQKECGACHIAYPPRTLAATQWRTVMSGLDRHYGSDASLPQETAARIDEFLAKHGGGGAKVTSASTPPRVTDTPWFRDEHRELPAGTFASPAVGGAGNCAACHREAAKGDYSERSIVVPGLERTSR